MTHDYKLSVQSSNILWQLKFESRAYSKFMSCYVKCSKSTQIILANQARLKHVIFEIWIGMTVYRYTNFVFKNFSFLLCLDMWRAFLI